MLNVLATPSERSVPCWGFLDERHGKIQVAEARQVAQARFEPASAV